MKNFSEASLPGPDSRVWTGEEETSRRRRGRPAPRRLPRSVTRRQRLTSRQRRRRVRNLQQLREESATSKSLYILIADVFYIRKQFEHKVKYKYLNSRYYLLCEVLT